MTRDAEIIVRFQKFLLIVQNEVSIVLKKGDPNLVKGALTTACIPLHRFLEMFSELLAAEDYRMESWKKHSQAKGYQIGDDVFEAWKNVGCLVD